MLGPNKPSIPGVGKFRKNIKNLKKKAPYKEPLIIYLLGYGGVRRFWENHTVFSGNKKGFRV